MSVNVLGPPERPEEVPGITNKVMRGESIQHHTSERIRKDGARIAVDISLSPIRNQRGEVIGASSIAHDITAQRRSEEALRRNEKLATAGRLAAAVAHEINNPLEAVLNLIYLARHRPDSQDQYLEMAEREVLRIAAIAQQMLGFVRESSSASPLNVAATLDDVLQLYLRQLNEKHIKVNKHYDSAVEIRGFAGELRQLFSNLILNALDALEDGEGDRADRPDSHLRTFLFHQGRLRNRPGLVALARHCAEARGIDPRSQPHHCRLQRHRIFYFPAGPCRKNFR
jgi:signal transduction histidine kinase